MSRFQVPNRRSGLFLHEDEDLHLYGAAIDTMIDGPGGRKVAMSPEASSELIAEIAHEMEAME